MTISELKLDMWIDVLIAINDNPRTNITQLQRNVNCTYAHLLGLLELLEEHELIIIVKETRAAEIKTSRKGKVVAIKLYPIKKLLDSWRKPK